MVETVALWLGAGVMMVGTLVYLYMGRTVTVSNDTFFVMAMSVTIVAATAYLTMALGMGRVTVGGREVLAVRYADWMVTTPLLLALLGMVANASRSVIATLVGLDVYMVGTGFLAVLAEPLWQTLVWWGISTLAFVVMLYLLLGVLSAGAREQPEGVYKVYRRLRNLTVVLWSLYPVVWIAGGNGLGVLPAEIEVVSFVVLDVLAKVVFGLVLLRSHDTVQVHSFYTQGRGKPSAGDRQPADD
jgi:bacteriorhodopsin